jgi:hypothetical protein
VAARTQRTIRLRTAVLGEHEEPLNPRMAAMLADKVAAET